MRHSITSRGNSYSQFLNSCGSKYFLCFDVQSRQIYQCGNTKGVQIYFLYYTNDRSIVDNIYREPFENKRATVSYSRNNTEGKRDVTFSLEQCLLARAKVKPAPHGWVCHPLRCDPSICVHVYAWTHRDGSQRNAWKKHPCVVGLTLIHI